MKLSKTKMLLCAVGALFLSLAVSAIPVEARTAFDYNYYYEKYADARWECGNDAQALYNHYMTVGVAEGRYPTRQAEWKAAAGYVFSYEERTDVFLMSIPASDSANADSTLPKLDPMFYYNTYADVAEVIGEDPVALLQHYFQYGYSEGRLAYYGATPCTDIQTSY